MSFPTVVKPVLSPSLAEYDLPTIVDQNGHVISLMGVCFPDANGHTTLPAGSTLVVAEPTSQVTGKRQPPQVGASKIPCVGLMSLDPSTGAPVPFQASSATAVSGKFQSTQLTGTGSQQTIPHGLGVAPTLVLASVQDNTASGSTPFTFVIVEGSHTSTNLLLTVTSGCKYKVIAFV